MDSTGIERRVHISSGYRLALSAPVGAGRTEEQAKSQLALQKREGQLALELKVAELLMSGHSPSMARERAALLAGLYEEGMSSKFLELIKNAKQFPGDLGIQMREAFFTQAASKYDNPRRC